MIKKDLDSEEIFGIFIIAGSLITLLFKDEQPKTTQDKEIFDIFPRAKEIVWYLDEKRYKYEIWETEDGKCYYIHFQEEVSSYYYVETGELVLFNESEKYMELWEQLVLVILEEEKDVGAYFEATGTHFKYDFDYG